MDCHRRLKKQGKGTVEMLLCKAKTTSWLHAHLKPCLRVSYCLPAPLGIPQFFTDCTRQKISTGQKILLVSSPNTAQDNMEQLMPSGIYMDQPYNLLLTLLGNWTNLINVLVKNLSMQMGLLV